MDNNQSRINEVHDELTIRTTALHNAIVSAQERLDGQSRSALHASLSEFQNVSGKLMYYAYAVLANNNPNPLDSRLKTTDDNRIGLGAPITDEEWKMLIGIPRNKGVYRFLLSLRTNCNEPQRASPFMDYGCRITTLNSSFKLRGLKFRIKCVWGHGNFEIKEYKLVRIP